MNRKRSLFAIVMAGIALALLLPTGLALLFYRKTVLTTMTREARANVDYYIDQTAANAEECIAKAREIAYAALLNDAVRQFMTGAADAETGAGRAALSAIVGERQMFATNANRRIVRSVYLFRDDDAFIAYAPMGATTMKHYAMTAVRDELAHLSSATTLYASAQETGQVYFALDYKNINSMKRLGKLLIELDSEKIGNAENIERIYPDTAIFLWNEADSVLYHNGRELPAQDALKDYYVSAREISDGALTLEAYAPLTSVYGEINRISALYAAFSGVALTGALVAAFVMLAYMRGEFRRMEEGLRQMASQRYDVRLPDSRYAEIDRMSEAFNTMADSLNASLDEAYERGVELQQTESRLLAAQINPHFIFNVLEAINMKCVAAGQRDISLQVTDLAQLLRGNIGAGTDQMITLEQELRYAHYYMELQKSRFGEKLKYSTDYEDESLLQYRIPRLSVQPLVENAVAHGLEPKSGMGEVKLRAWEEADKLCVMVTDDGVGIRDDDVRNGVALSNIRRRLELIYKDAATLTVEPMKEGGTRALLTVPTLESMDDV